MIWLQRKAGGLGFHIYHVIRYVSTVKYADYRSVLEIMFILLSYGGRMKIAPYKTPRFAKLIQADPELQCTCLGYNQ